MTTASLFDIPAPTPEADVLGAQARIAKARAARDEGMDQAARHASDQWNRYAWDFLYAYLKTHPTLFTDDLWQSDGNPAGLRRPPTTMRAFGPIVQRAAREGLIVKTGEYRPRTFGHLAEGPVWRSLLYPDPA